MPNPTTDDVDEARELELNSIDPALEAALRVLMGYRLADLLRDALNLAQVWKVSAGESDPCDFFDDNEFTFQAYADTFGRPFACELAEHRQRANAATRVAAGLLRYEPSAIPALLLTGAAENDSVGLSHTITRNKD